MNKAWLEMMGFASEEEARKVMSERGAKGKGVKKSRNWLKDDPSKAKELGKIGGKARWQSRGTKD